MLTARALGFLLTGGRSIGKLPQPLLEAGRMNIAGIPLVFILGLAVALLFGFVLSRTAFGQRIHLTGSSAGSLVLRYRDRSTEIPSLPDFRHAGRSRGLCLHDAPWHRLRQRRVTSCCCKSLVPSCWEEPR